MENSPTIEPQKVQPIPSVDRPNDTLAGEQEYFDPSPRQRQDWESDRYFKKLSQKEFLWRTWEIENLDIDAFSRTAWWMIDRHESLRAYFPLIDGNIRMAFHPVDDSLFGVEIHDLSAVGDQTANIEHQLFIQYVTVVCRLEIGPLFKLYAIKISERLYKITFCMHHIISDAWSVVVISREFQEHYQALTEGRVWDPPPPLAGLREYCRDKNRRQNPAEIALHRGYWLQQLGAFGPERATAMWNNIIRATDPASVPDTYDQLWKKMVHSPAHSYTTVVAAPLIDDLRSLAKDRKVSLKTVIYLGLYLAYQKCFGIDLILFASPVADRFHPAYKDLVGNLTGGLYLPHDLSLAVDSITRLQAINTAFMRACRHLIFNHDDMQLEGAPLRMNCNCFINFEPSRHSTEPLPEIRSVHTPYENSFYALACGIKEYADGLTCMWSYREKLHGPEEVERMANHLNEELKQLADSCKNRTS